MRLKSLGKKVDNHLIDAAVFLSSQVAKSVRHLHRQPDGDSVLITHSIV